MCLVSVGFPALHLPALANRKPPEGREEKEGSWVELFISRPPSSRLPWQQRSQFLSGGLFHIDSPLNFSNLPLFRLGVGTVTRQGGLHSS